MTILPAFSPGKPYAAPGVKLRLYASSSGRRTLCDSAVLMCGLPGPAPAYHLPLDADDLRRPPEQLLDDLTALHVPGDRLPAAAPGRRGFETAAPSKGRTAGG